MWLIVGLGNPGAKYELTRHNLGFLVIDALLDETDNATTRQGFSGKVARVDLFGEPCVLLKPETFMNRSGTSVQQAMAFHKIALDHLLVIHDDLDLNLGDVRIKRGGGHGGHNGLRDITRLIGPDFIRLRMGIGRPPIKGMEADYVLSPFSDQELELVADVNQKAKGAVEALLKHGFLEAQSKYQIRAEK